MFAGAGATCDGTKLGAESGTKLGAATDGTKLGAGTGAGAII